MAPVEVWTLRGLRTFMVLFAIRHHSRKVEILGITDAITDEFSTNAAKNLLDVDAKPLNGITHLILDRDAKFTPAFKTFVERAGVKIVLTPPRSPDCNSICERWVGTLRRELLNRMIFLGEAHIRAAVGSFAMIIPSEVINRSRTRSSSPVTRWAGSSADSSGAIIWVGSCGTTTAGSDESFGSEVWLVESQSLDAADHCAATEIERASTSRRPGNFRSRLNSAMAESGILDCGRRRNRGFGHGCDFGHHGILNSKRRRNQSFGCGRILGQDGLDIRIPRA